MASLEMSSCYNKGLIQTLTTLLKSIPSFRFKPINEATWHEASSFHYLIGVKIHINEEFAYMHETHGSNELICISFLWQQTIDMDIEDLIIVTNKVWALIQSTISYYTWSASILYLHRYWNPLRWRVRERTWDVWIKWYPWCCIQGLANDTYVYQRPYWNQY